MLYVKNTQFFIVVIFYFFVNACVEVQQVIP